MDAGPKIVLNAADIVGESIVYDNRRDALLWVDICGKRIHRLHLGSGGHEVWPHRNFRPPSAFVAMAAPSSDYVSGSCCGITGTGSSPSSTSNRICPAIVSTRAC